MAANLKAYCLEALNNIKLIAAGRSHSLAARTGQRIDPRFGLLGEMRACVLGEVFSFGANEDDQLGRDVDVCQQAQYPSRAPFIVRFCAGFSDDDPFRGHLPNPRWHRRVVLWRRAFRSTDK